ncbi:MAG: putative toxin-antitoxin system toxin component, PIN family [Burkholderiales bacterium]|nr:putative toxin-antitoxin system toxin component, PIN family [Anaerolineae bacterium]
MIDTQIFLRAAMNRKSLPAKIIFDLRHAYQLIVSDAIVLEVQNVLNRPELQAKFPQLTEGVVDQVIELLEAAEIVNPAEVQAVARDPKDDMFLACAKASSAHYLVSEDKDLLVLNPYGDVQIVNALDFLRVLQDTKS